MPQFNPDIHHRRSLRLKNYDYSSTGAYFVTVCAQNMACMFGEIGNGEMILNGYGDIVRTCWNAMPKHFSDVQIDTFIVMPNHVHGIIMIVDHGRGMACHAPTNRQFSKPIANSLPTIVGSFKSAVTKQINTIRNAPHAPVWQRNYYEHIIRNEKSLDKIREYIMNNPLNWATDIEYPGNTGRKTADEYYKDIVEKQL